MVDLIVRVHLKPIHTHRFQADARENRFDYDESWLMPNNDRKSETSNHFTFRMFFGQLEQYQHQHNPSTCKIVQDEHSWALIQLNARHSSVQVESASSAHSNVLSLSFTSADTRYFITIFSLVIIDHDMLRKWNKT